MGYQTWHNYGYGIRTDNIKTTADKMAELIKLAPKFAEEVKNNFIEHYETDTPTMDDYLDYDQDYVTILDGNGNGKGLIAIRKMKWDCQTFRAKYIIQPTQMHFDILYSV